MGNKNGSSIAAVIDQKEAQSPIWSAMPAAGNSVNRRAENSVGGSGQSGDAGMAYPGNLFEKVANGTRAQAPFDPSIGSDTSAAQSDGGHPLKRGLDALGALVVTCLISPFLLPVAMAIGMTSRGTVTFKQSRFGKLGYPFTFYKCGR